MIVCSKHVWNKPNKWNIKEEDQMKFNIFVESSSRTHALFGQTDVAYILFYLYQNQLNATKNLHETDTFCLNW